MPASPRPPARCELLVAGAGIVGLATARAALVRRPGTGVVVLEAGPAVAGGQTARNSGVIHAGIAYAPGSLKARLCVAGARSTYALAAELGVPTERCGKLIVARDERELGALDELERRATANGVTVRRLDPAGIAAAEPHAAGIAALHSPDTGIVDFAALARALAADIERRGGTIVLRCPVARLAPEPRGVLVHHAAGITLAARAVACAGAQSDRLAARSGCGPDPRIVPFRGAYARLTRPELVRGLIYPVPDPGLPFLGVHFTRRIQGDVVVGPTALPVGARDARSAWSVRPGDARDTLLWPGTWRLARRWPRQAGRELAYAASRSALARAAAGLVPGLRAVDLAPSFAGVRAQALGRDGTLVDDFVLEHRGPALHVRNAPSPAATSAPAIAEELLDRLAAGR